ncbi:PAS domain-containing protein [Streptomyces aureoverticillatus]|uniref:PAS domain-containing protein n=1 Tax=Streptomyces aureoverticillatus TaxID=66871 RepID=UPI0013DD1519|nr:PAS domain-containing protein [Streptomyces aureoverticillatus]QIB42628.1 PAS domain-containing protein [Streptomyces aureoverticillatus]
MAETERFSEDLADFVRRVAELKASRAVPSGDLRPMLDAALFELDHVAERLWPGLERLGSEGPAAGERAAREEQRLLRTVFQRFPLPVALVDGETVVRRMNPAATDLTGVRGGYATGRPLAGFLTPSDRSAFRSQAAAVARGEGDRSLTVRLQHRPRLPVRATLTGLRPGSEPRTVVLVVLQPPAAGDPPQLPGARDAVPRGVRGRAPDLAEATRHAELLELSDTVTVALLTAPPGDRAGVLARVAEVLHGRFADWVIVDEGAAGPRRRTVLGPEGAADPEGAAGSAGAGPVADVLAQDPADCPLVLETARCAAPTLQVRPDPPDSFGRDASGAPVLVRANVTSLLCVPLAPHANGPGGPVLGVLSLFRTGARLAFSMAEARAVDVMARHIALAMRRPG